MFSVATSLCIWVSLSACFESLQFIVKIHRKLHVTAALACRLCAGVYVFTTVVSALEVCADSWLSGKEVVKTIARWHCCVMYLSTQCPLPFSTSVSITWLFLIFYHPPFPPLFLTIPFFYAQHVW